MGRSIDAVSCLISCVTRSFLRLINQCANEKIEKELDFICISERCPNVITNTFCILQKRNNEDYIRLEINHQLIPADSCLLPCHLLFPLFCSELLSGATVGSTSKFLQFKNMSSCKVLYFITGSANKVKETTGLLPSDFPYDVSCLVTRVSWIQLTFSCLTQLEPKSIDLPELQGEPNEIAIAKCKSASELIKQPLITEDTCLCFNALNGLPGPYIRSFVDKIGVEAIPRVLDGFHDKSAYALCTLGYFDGQEVRLFQGRVDGVIVEANGRPDAFGWDLIFKPNGYNETFGQLDPVIKSKISHRSRAVTAFADYISQTTLLN